MKKIVFIGVLVLIALIVVGYNYYDNGESKKSPSRLKSSTLLAISNQIPIPEDTVRHTNNQIDEFRVVNVEIPEDLGITGQAFCLNKGYRGCSDGILRENDCAVKYHYDNKVKIS